MTARPRVGVVTEGRTDRPVAEKLLRHCDLEVHPDRVIDTGGKPQLDARLEKYNAAAAHGPWLVLRDSDHQEGDCPVALRQRLLPPDAQAHLLSFRLVVPCLEAWLLADRPGFAAHFSVSIDRLPTRPEILTAPKVHLVNMCAQSRRRDVREGMARGSSGRPGPLYTVMVSDFVRDTWDVDRAMECSPSLVRAVADLRARFQVA